MTEQRGQGDDSGDGARDLERTLEAARRAAPALTPSRTQTWRWAVSSRLDGRRRSRIPALAAACAAAAVLAGVLAGWRALGPGSDVAASGPSLSPARHASDADGQIVLADGSRVVPDGPTTVLDKASRIRRRHPLRARGGRRALRGRPASIPDLPRARRAGDGAGDRHAVPGATSGRPFHGLGHGRTRPGLVVGWLARARRG